VQVDAAFLSSVPGEVRSRYGLPEKFFFLPNQIWKHKNHRVVIEAVSQLRASGMDVCVAVSGQARDHRHSQLFNELEKQVVNLGIQKQIRFLGLVPYGDVLELMRACTALINPSYCEGWSTPVEEAKSLGVPMLLSNLAVHREQAGNQAVYFNPDSPDELARCMKNHMALTLPDSASREAEAARQVPGRLAQFALAFARIVDAAA
jgi:glycosyltransferase involved in cell wall biosynthesis